MVRLKVKIEDYLTANGARDEDLIQEACNLLGAALDEIDRLEEYEWMYKDLAE